MGQWMQCLVVAGLYGSISVGTDCSRGARSRQLRLVRQREGSPPSTTFANRRIDRTSGRSEHLREVLAHQVAARDAIPLRIPYAVVTPSVSSSEADATIVVPTMR